MSGQESSVWKRALGFWGGGFLRRLVVHSCLFSLVALVLLRDVFVEMVASGDPVPIILVVVAILMMAGINALFHTVVSAAVGAVVTSAAKRVLSGRKSSS